MIKILKVKTIKMELKTIVIYQVKKIQIVMVVIIMILILLHLHLETLQVKTKRRKRRRKIKKISNLIKKQNLVKVKYQMKIMIQVILDLNLMIPLLNNVEKKSMDQTKKRKIKKELRINLQHLVLHLMLDQK